jgi:hypothetical protein
MCPQIPIPSSDIEASLVEEETDDPRDPANLEALALAISSNPPQVYPVQLVYETNSRFHADTPAR